MKVLDPKKLWNFVDYNIFIWICLGPQTIIFCFFCFFFSNCDFWNWAKILLLAQTAQSSITLAKLAGPYISSHLTTSQPLAAQSSPQSPPQPSLPFAWGLFGRTKKYCFGWLLWEKNTVLTGHEQWFRERKNKPAEQALTLYWRSKQKMITYVFNSHLHLLALAIILQSNNATAKNCSEKHWSNTTETLISDSFQTQYKVTHIFFLGQ